MNTKRSFYAVTGVKTWTEAPKTLLLTSHKLGSCWFAGGNFAVPFYIKAVVSQGYTWYVISIGADVFTGTTSIYTLAVISLERMYAVGWPLRHRTVNYRVYVCAISIPWIIAAIFTTLVVLRIFNIIGKEYFFYYHVLIPGIPLITICVANFVVWKKQKSPFRDQNHIKREVKLAKTLALLTGISLFTWLLFQILNNLIELNVMENVHLFPLTPWGDANRLHCKYISQFTKTSLFLWKMIAVLLKLDDKYKPAKKTVQKQLSVTSMSAATGLWHLTGKLPGAFKKSQTFS